MTVSFHPAAAAEVERAQRWYEERSVLAAAGFLQELTRAVERGRLAPDRYPAAEHGTRRVLLDQYPSRSCTWWGATRSSSSRSRTTSDVRATGPIVQVHYNGVAAGDRLGTRERVVYTPRDEHRMYSFRLSSFRRQHGQ